MNHLDISRISRRARILGAVAGCLLATFSAAADQGAPSWPLDLNTRYLTSNFMEYRPGRFHAGLDLKTRSREGFAARAVEDGWIVRVRATPGAYGRAVYLRGASGKTYVYAHLSRFNDVLREKVRASQRKTGRYRTRLSFAPGRIPVGRGDVIGLTGQSGTGGPHLHFEVRDRKNRPVNPLDHGFAGDDRIAPVIHALRAVPVSPSARIDGTAGARVLDGPLSGVLPTLHLYGPVAFSAKIIDAADIAGHRLEPWLIEVRLDGELVYSCRNISFGFGESSLQRLEWLEVEGIRDRWLHRRAANTLTGRQGDAWYLGSDGRGLPRGDHLLEITASDHAGNIAAVTLPLEVGRAPRDTSAWRVEPVCVTTDPLSNGQFGNRLTPFFEVLPEERSAWTIRRLAPEKGDPVHAPVRLGFRQITLTAEQRESAATQGLAVLSEGVEYAAADWPISASVPVAWPDPIATGVDSLREDGRSAVFVYRWTPRGWRVAGSLQESGVPDGVPRFHLADLGLHAVLVDDTAPVVAAEAAPLRVTLNDTTEAHGVTLPRWEIFPVTVTDAGSGVAVETIEARLDGEPLVVEPDLIRDRVLVELPDRLPAGFHRLALAVEDKAGHRTAAELAFECVADPPE